MDNEISTLQVTITDGSEDCLEVALLVDGHRFGDDPVDLFELKRSATESGELFILTCECGEPGCAGFFKGIDVERDGDIITWAARSDYYPRPQYKSVDEPERVDAPMICFRFDRHRYVHAIREALAVLRVHPRGRSVMRGFGFYEHTLEALFSDDLAPACP